VPVTETETGGSQLAGAFPAKAPGLPRGRGRMPAEDVQRAQRERIQRAAISAFADAGFEATTVADIVARARVSRRAFYGLFESKEECLLAAVDAGREMLLPRIAKAAVVSAPLPYAESVRAVVREYLRVCASEPEFTRAWTVDLPIAGPRALKRRNDYFDTLADFARMVHTSRGVGDALPDSLYLAVIGGCHELFFRYVIDGRTEALPELEDPIVQILLTWLP
jgi:AcrR family transcriptional regulator